MDKALGIINVERKAPVFLSSGQQSIGAALQNISLVAYAKGYGTTCMFGPVLAYKEIGELLEVGEPWVLASLMPIGIPAQNPRPRPRADLQEVYRLIK